MTIADKVNDYQILKKRQPLSIEQKDEFYSVYYGYSGEQSFAELLPAVSIVRDLRVRSISKGLAQFDIIVVHDQTVTHYDIKNYKGQFTVQNHGLTNQYGKYFKNPDDQLDRAHYILEEYVRDLILIIKLKVMSSLLMKVFIFPVIIVIQNGCSEVCLVVTCNNTLMSVLWLLKMQHSVTIYRE